LIQVWVNWTEVAEVIIKFSGTSSQPSSADWPGDSLESENVIAFIGMFLPLPMFYGCHVTWKALSVPLVRNCLVWGFQTLKTTQNDCNMAPT
jgi:hypothetical protein